MEKNDGGLTRTLARFIVGTNEVDIPSHVYEHAKIAFLDWIGVTIAGKDDPLVKKLLGYVNILGGNEQATILGHKVKKSMSHAALINGSASHVLDYDDVMMAFLGHPSVTMFPSLLALAEFKEKSGADFLTAYIIGFKIGCVVGACAGKEHYMTGWHATGTLGHFTSAAVCSRILGLDEKQTIHALGIAGTMASGLRRSFGTMCKPFHAGKAAQGGLMGAMLAAEGFTAATDIFEGPNGFFQAFKGGINEQALGTLGRTWEIEYLAQKYHASCYGTHSPIEASLNIVKSEELDGKDINSINVQVSPLAMSAASKTEPRTGLEGKFSINYCVANALLRGNTGMQAFTDERVNDEEVQDFMRKISVSADNDLNMMEARVEINTGNGRIYSKFKDVDKEIPPLETKNMKIRDKFSDICGPVLGGRKANEFVDAVLSLEKVNNIKSLIEMIE